MAIDNMSIELFIEKENTYGDKYRDHLFEQYKLYCDSIEKISDRRQNANNYFITINTALITLFGLSFQINMLKSFGWFRPILAFVGIIICTIFWFLLRSYKQMNSGKFKVIHLIEQRLPLALYNYEWEILGKGKDKKIYFPFSHIELLVPWVFGIIYIVFGIICVFGNIN
jgi:hypothetical protein